MQSAAPDGSAITNNVKYVNHGSETTTLEAVEEPETTVPVEETPAVEETANVCGDELTWKLDEKKSVRRRGLPCPQR